MQLAIAGHQFEHSAAYTDVCDICVQMDRLDDVVAEAPAVVDAFRPADDAAISLPEVFVGKVHITCFNPRAPPLV